MMRFYTLPILGAILMMRVGCALGIGYLIDPESCTVRHSPFPWMLITALTERSCAAIVCKEDHAGSYGRE